MQKGKITYYEAFKNEINILMQLDHPNIIKLHETWETDRICFLVTELCEGGELFFHITNRKYLTEAQAAQIMRQAFYALCYLHNNKICHRDIKPENFLLYKENDDSFVKLIDFGLAKRVSKNEVMNAPNGTPYYIAPEVLKGSYTTQCDNWSMGVVMFIMLSGKPPFGGRSNKEIIDNVLRGQYSFSSPVWQSISDEAKDLINKLLDRQADMRLTAQEAYEHPWIQLQRQKEFGDVEISKDVFSNMQNYMDSVALKRTTLSFIASRIPEDQIQTLRVAFGKMDVNGDGQLTIEELKEGLKDVPEIMLSPEDITKAMTVIDSNQNGLIDYTEFIAACLQSYNYLKENHLRTAFAYFDADNSGTITRDELRQCLQSDDFTLSEEQINDLLNGVDSNNDGQIDYVEFIAMMKDNLGM